jgi:hypothetical protein
MWLYPDPAQALGLAVRSCAVGQLIGLGELLLVRREMASGGFLDWTMTGILSPHTRTRAGSLARRLFRRLSARAVLTLAVIDALVVGALLAWPSSGALIGAAVVLQLALVKRHHLTIDGSDQMMFVVLLTCFFGSLGGGAWTARAAVAFLAAELTLSYLVAGLYKAASKYWQSGGAFVMLVQTRMYGLPLAARTVRRCPAVGTAADYAVLSWESLFFLALVSPPPVVVVILAVGISFHVGCGVIMGLNRFLWAFVASYPAFLCTNAWLRALLGGHRADAIAIAALVPGVMALLVSHRLNTSTPGETTATAPSPTTSGRVSPN